MKRDQKAESQRFIDAAREIGADETGEAFERAFGKIVPPKLPTPDAQPKRKKPSR